MKQVHGVWMPEDETHFVAMMGETGNYQKDTFDIAMKYIKSPKVFYDVGAHIGLWSLQAIKAGFKTIHAYEPNPETFECLRANLDGRGGDYKAHLNNYGIARNRSSMRLIKEKEGNSGAVKLDIDITQAQSNDKTNRVQLTPINDFFMPQDMKGIKPHETLVKIDTEGMEAACILGMDKILYALRPVVCVEQRTNNDALKILQQMGMEVVKIVRRDYILTWQNL